MKPFSIQSSPSLGPGGVVHPHRPKRTRAATSDPVLLLHDWFLPACTMFQVQAVSPCSHALLLPVSWPEPPDTHAAFELDCSRAIQATGDSAQAGGTEAMHDAITAVRTLLRVSPRPRTSLFSPKVVRSASPQRLLDVLGLSALCAPVVTCT